MSNEYLARHPRVLAAAVSSLLCVALLPAPAIAADALHSGGLDEVLVTARRVEERLQDTPISVSAFQARDIEKLSIRNVGDTAAFTPNFISNPGPTGGNDGYFFIRGVGQTDLNPATDPGVATYIDGVYMGRIMGASMDAVDIARIEVLRGPQGTLFGRNTIGGALNITTRDPAEEFGGRVMVGAGSRDLVNVQGSFDVPLGKNAGLLLSAAYRDQDGWGDRADGEIFDSNESKSGRLKYKWNPNDTFSLVLTGDITDLGGTSQHTILTDFNPTVFSPLGVPLPNLTPYLDPSDPYDNQTSISPDKDYDIKGTGLTLGWDLGWANLKSISSYRSLKQYITTDFDSSPYSFYEGGFDTDQDQWSQELHLSGETGRFQWLIGAFYYDEHNEHTNIISLGGNNGCNPLPFGPPPFCNFAAGEQYATPGVIRKITNNQAFDLDTTAMAVFGHMSVELSERWSVSLGLRWTDEEKDQVYDFFIDNTDNVFNLAGLPPIVLPTLSADNPFNTAPVDYNKSWSDVTPKAGVEFKPADDQLYYFSYQQGFKSGGFNGRPTPGPNGSFQPISPYDPEEMDSYEIGAKTQWAEDRVRLNVAIFQSDYEGIQLLGLGDTGFFETINAAESRIRGAELELLARPIPEFELQAGFGYTDNDYQELNQGTILSGVDYGMLLPVTPEYNASLGAQYTWQLAAGTLALRGDYSYRSKQYFEASNTPGNRQDSYGLFNARATFASEDEKWSVAVYGLNLNDEVYLTNAQDVAPVLGVSFASISAPREWGAELRYAFH